MHNGHQKRRKAAVRMDIIFTKIGSTGRIKCNTVKGGDSNTAPADSAGIEVCWIMSDKPNVEQKQKLKKSCKRIFKEYIFAKLF